MNILPDTPVSAEDLRTTAGSASKSERMRILARKGYATARIADALGVRYQFVRNVLAHEARTDRTAPEPDPFSVAEQTPPAFVDHASETLRLVVEEGGLIRLPPEAMETLGVRAGSIVIALREADRMVLLSGAAAWRRVQDMVRAMNIAPERILSDELIQERRAEAAAEDRRG